MDVGDDNNADEEWLRVAEDVYGVKFSDYIAIDQDVAICDNLSIEEMCDNAKNKNKGEEAEDKVHADEAEPTPVTSLSDAIMAFKTVRTFTYTHEITEKDQKKCVKS
ncbi:hypothetical protein NPIL_254231 [Nephila pilipes]|uniref:Uncharacterized protein n=1 Tax=Nephila pilipes TaxID=299642 RepID=A0A8X6U0Y8_NEPPI|nr:hypothetical protein NPIL_254231 [Nephila pilipes]